MAGDLLGLAGGHLLSTAFGAGGALMAPLTRELDYGNNRWISPKICASPPPDAIIAAYYGGRLGDRNNPESAIARDNLLLDHGIYWSGSRATGFQATDAQRQQWRGQAWWAMVDLAKPWVPLEAMREAWLRNLPEAEESDIRRALSRQGINYGPWQDWIFKFGQSPDWQIILYWWRRGWLIGDQIDRFLRRANIIEPELIALHKREYDAQLPGTREAIEMFFRLTPEQIGRYTAPGPRPIVWTEEDMNNVLRSHGFSAAISSRLVNAARPQVHHRQTAQAVQIGIRTQAWAAEKAKIEGFLPDDQTFFSDLADAHRLEHARQRMIGAVERAYDVGTLTPEQAKEQLYGLRIFEDDANWRLTAIDSEHIVKLVEQTIVEIRRSYLSGEVGVVEASVKLRGIGLQPQRVEVYLALWTVQLSTKHRQLETGQILSLLAECMITYEEAHARMLNLGWVNPDSLLLVGRSQAACLKRQAALDAVAQRSAAQRAKLIQAQIAEVDREKKRLLSEAKQAEPLADLKRYYLDDVITEGVLQTRMHEYGFTPEFINWTLRDLDFRKGRATARSQGKKVGKPPPAPKREALASLKTFLIDGVIDLATFEQRLKDEGYPEEFIQWQVADLRAKGKIA